MEGEYEGEYVNGRFDGQGTYKLPDGIYYQGISKYLFAWMKSSTVRIFVE